MLRPTRMMDISELAHADKPYSIMRSENQISVIDEKFYCPIHTSSHILEVIKPKRHLSHLSSITKQSFMKFTFSIILIGFCYTLSALGQSTLINASITLTSPAPTCSFVRNTQLTFGSVEKPGTGTASVVVNAQTGQRTSNGVTASGDASVGQMHLSGSNVANYSVSRSFPSNLSKSTDQLTFSGTWSQSTTSGSGYSTISGTSYSGTASGTSFSRYFRFGGTVSGINISDASGTYTGTITATATCS